MENTRECTICHVIKPFSDFNWDNRFNLPFSRCKQCYNEKCRRYRHSQQGREKYRKWVTSEQGKKVRKKAGDKWQTSHKNQQMAVYTVHNAVRDGKLFRQPCEICGELKVEAHHTSYKKEDWLKVMWLCVKHHKEIHRKN